MLHVKLCLHFIVSLSKTSLFGSIIFPKQVEKGFVFSIKSFPLNLDLLILFLLAFFIEDIQIKAIKWLDTARHVVILKFAFLSLFLFRFASDST